METEIWPLLYKICHTQIILISIINARLSHRTLKTNRWIKSLYKTSLTYVDKILCKSETELNHFKQLGASDKKLVVAGNLKFTFIANTKNISGINLNNRKYYVAASTHNNEEQQLASLWKKINTDTLGELTQFMQGSEWVFIGGSLIKHGGQNILEACRLGKTTICGPHMFNFKDELQLLLKNEACVQAHNISEL